MKIEYYVKNVYGNDLMYVADPKLAENLTTLTGKKTLDWSAMQALVALGFLFEQVLSPKAE